MNVDRDTNDVRFFDDDAIYSPDACVPLAAAAETGVIALSALARGHYPGRPFDEGSVDGVRTIGSWDATTDQDWGLDWHRNEGIELTFVAKGNVAFALDEQAWNLHAGQVTVTRPWQRHRVGDPDVSACNLHWVVIDVGVRRPNQTWLWPDWVALAPRDLARLTTMLQHNEHAVWKAGPALGEAFLSATRLATSTGPMTESDLRIRISALLLELLKTLEAEKPHLDESLTTPQRGVRIFLDQLEEQVEHRWSLAAMAASCSMGRTQFARHCQELTNMAPIEYLNHVRVQQAKALLASTSRPVTDIAMMCGFETPQYFATRFRALTGSSPTAYRAGFTPH